MPATASTIDEEARKEHGPIPVADERQHPHVCVRAGGEVRAHVGRPLPRLVERAREPGLLLNLEVGQEERQHDGDRTTAAAIAIAIQNGRDVHKRRDQA